ncbi:hypothetical protein D3C81_1093740 [compost metagenome]
MGAGPVPRRLPLKQFDQPARLAQLRTDTQHANGRCHGLCAAVHCTQQVRGRGFTYLLDGQQARSVALASTLHLASPVEAVHAHYHLWVISLRAGVNPGFDDLAQGPVTLALRVDQHVPFDGHKVGRELAGRGLAPLRLKAVEKAGEFNE